MNTQGKMEEADKLMKKAMKLCNPSIVAFRIKPDWEAACPMFERAALCYKQAGAMDKALHAYERSATAQEKQGSQWHAAKHMEICGEICKNLQRWEDVANFYQRAAQLYQDAGRASTGADALARAARALEEKEPKTSYDLYVQAIDMYETDGKEGQAADVFRSAIGMLCKKQDLPNAATLLLQFGAVCDKTNSRSTQCKCYLGAIVVYLYAQDAKQAWQVFQDCLEVSNFVSCEEAFAADALFLAYKSGSADAVRKVVSEKYAFKNLDNQVARLAAKLPQGDLAEQGKLIMGAMGGRATGDSAEEEEAEEEELL